LALGAGRCGLLEAAWRLTDRIAVRDALYVALANSLEATLVTTDRRLRKAVGEIVAVAEPRASSGQDSTSSRTSSAR
jgi:predicted nucleic acid-binding protein